MTAMTPLERDRLLIALLMDDVITAINTALNARKAVLTLDYEDGIRPKLMISMPGSKPAQWLITDPRTKRCHGTWPRDPDLALTVRDVMERLKKLDAHLAIGCIRRPNKKPEAKLQVFVKGSTRTAVTLFSVFRGERKSQPKFLLPEGFRT